MYGTLFRKALYPLYEQVIAGRKTPVYLNEYAENLARSTEALERIQLVKLKALLVHAYSSCSYYKQQWDSIGFDPEGLTSTHEIEQLPPINKDIIRENYDGFISELYRGKNIRKATGGSSGVPFQFELDQQSNQRRQAVMWRGYDWLGAGLGQRTLHVWGANIRPIGKKSELKEALYHAFYHRKMLNSFEMREDNLAAYIDEINRYKATAIVAYVNPMVMLADFVLENKLTVHAPQAILTGAEPLYAFQRERIEQAFAAPVYNTYGCREFMLIGAECQQKNGFHLNVDHLLVESLDVKGNAVTGSGDLAITDLHNYGFPLIRYLNGDRGSLLPQKSCACGSPLPLMQSVEGRKLDVIRTPEGKILPGEFFPHLLKDYKSIKQFQVVQNIIDEVIFKLVLNNGDTQGELAEIQSLVEQYLGVSTKVVIEIVDVIDLTSSGKRRVTVSNI